MRPECGAPSLGARWLPASALSARWLSVAAALAIVLATPGLRAPGPVSSGLAFAHPLGNFSINHYTALRTEPDAVLVRYVVDLAEIPTFQEMQETGLVPEPGHPSVGPYLARRAESLKEGLRLDVDGTRAELRVAARDIAFTPGAGALPTMRVDVVYRAPLHGGSQTVRLGYQDGNHMGRAGWREIVAAAGQGTALAESTAPSGDFSRGLTEYPAELLQRPPQDLSARIVFSRTLAAVTAPGPVPGPGPVRADSSAAGAGPRTSWPVGHPTSGMGARRAVAPRAPTDQAGAMDAGVAGAKAEDRADHAPAAARDLERVPRPEHEPDEARAWPAPKSGSSAAPAIAKPAPRRLAPPSNALADLVTARGNGFGPNTMGFGLAASALVIAAGLGALHALEPGHGKTVVAAYLVGSRGTTWHAAMLGLIVTASHTAGVYLLGAATLYASRYVVPDRLYPWIAAGSGLVIAALGARLFFRRLAGRAVGHHHEHDHDHGPDHGHRHEHPHEHSQEPDHGHAHHHGHEHHHHHAFPANVSVAQLFALGVSGGIVPCPAALVVLLSAISLRRVGFGLLLVAAFSVGLAAVLVAIGILMVHARRLMARFTAEGPLVQRWLPLASSAVVACFGLAIAAQALAG